MSTRVIYSCTVAILILFFSLISDNAQAVCKNKMINPAKDVCWDCIFPIKIAGNEISGKDGGEGGDAPDMASALYCVCPWATPPYVRFGIPVSFWEPARYVETVKDPFCFPSVATQASGSGLGSGFSTGFGGSGSSSRGGGQIISSATVETSVFAQAHYYIFNIWIIMELLTDFVCLELSGFDIAYITETDPLWQDDLLTYDIWPETGLFANEDVQKSCMVDAVASNLSYPMSVMFWCMGSWGSAYPVTGHVNDDDYVQGNAAIAARLIYYMGRQFLICDPGVWLCGCVPTPIWVKHNYRMHIMKPVRDYSCHPIGRSGMFWEYGKNPPFSAGSDASDNFVWMIFRKRACCAF